MQGIDTLTDVYTVKDISDIPIRGFTDIPINRYVQITDQILYP